MGFDADVVEDLPTYEDLEYTPERVARYSQGEQPMNQTSAIDKSMEEVEVFECYIHADYDDDGIAELRKVVYAGNEILENEEIDYVPFCSICPIPMPHKFFGHSLADRTMDLQLNQVHDYPTDSGQPLPDEQRPSHGGRRASKPR